MDKTTIDVVVRELEDTDLGGVIALDEKISGEYRPDVWEMRIGYYMRRDPEALVVAEFQDKVVGFMLGEVRSGEFGLEEPTGWIEVLGVDPDIRGQAVGRRMAERMLEHFRRREATAVRTLVDDTMPEIAKFFDRIGFSEAPLKTLEMKL